ncbi:MAG: hypothetical protein GY953_26670 [bacterium]|nr:hypothetical protein [bacterium]
MLRLPEILEELDALDVPVLDRGTIEKVFGLRRRRAIELMHSFDGYQAGRAFLVDRIQLIERLRGIHDSPEFTREQRRKQRLTETIEKLRKYRQAAAVSLPVPAEAFTQPAAELPAGVSLAPGELRVEFGSAEQLLGKLFELAQAAANDYQRFQQVIERPSGQPSGSERSEV